MACALLQVSVAAVSLVDEGRLWHKAVRGLEAEPSPLQRSLCARVVTSGQPVVVEDAALEGAPAGAPRFFAGFPLEDPQGYVLGCLWVQDQEPRGLEARQRGWLEGLARQARALLETLALTQSHAPLYQRFFELSLDLLSISNLEGHFTRLSPAWEEVTGWTRRQLMERHSHSFVHPEDRDAGVRAAAHLRGLPASQQANLEQERRLLDFESRFLCADGSWRWLRWRCITDPKTQCVLSIAYDLTQERSYQQKLQQTALRATEANRAKTAFLTRLSHELKTPLNTIIGFSDLLSASPPGLFSPDQHREHLQRINHNGRRLRLLIDHILDMTRLEAGELTLYPAPFQLVDLVREQVAALEAHGAPSPPQVLLYLPEEAELLCADRHRTGQLLHHLLDNALKFGQGKPIQVQLLTDAQHRPLRLDVVDQGIGIEPALQDQIFQPFRQVEEGIARRFGGAGLGLPLVAALCHAMGFALRLHSTPHEGSTFSILLRPEPAT